MIMTSDKARKTAVRQRMAETGEPYSVARRAAQSAEAPPPGAAGPSAQDLSPDERYAREAEAAGRTAAQVETETLVFRAQERADRMQAAAELAREHADAAEEDAAEAAEHAELAREALDQAAGWADEAELGQARAIAERADAAAERARARADAAEDTAMAAEERAEMAQDDADELAPHAQSGLPFPGRRVSVSFGAPGPGRATRPAGRPGRPFPPAPQEPPMPPMPMPPPRW
jgi:hypothetical protein